MERLIVETVVYRPVEEVYELLLDFPRYGRYSDYLDAVETLDPGDDEQARYALRFAWWKLSYTARSAVTETVPNERIEWTIIDTFEAGGRWVVEEHETLPEDAPDWAETATTVRFEASWNPNSVDDSIIDLPRMVSLDWVITKVKPIVDKEAERIVRRAVADLEGRTRQVDLTVETEHVDT
ncbi:SRPBCC family protein [Halolamina sp.]|jgi:uncharacterized membrane protein|uniref:SRPBCC family protein n=1 Tax=Halolamina sp. TaxID=1940283 RepID=UPI000223B701|nr:cyclase/dehydrase [halophilic archaeon DL31]